jgi:hypothetical protein
MTPITIGDYTLALQSDGTLRVRVGSYVLAITPGGTVEPRVETLFLPASTAAGLPTPRSPAVADLIRACNAPVPHFLHKGLFT